MKRMAFTANFIDTHFIYVKPLFTRHACNLSVLNSDEKFMYILKNIYPCSGGLFFYSNRDCDPEIVIMGDSADQLQ